MADKEELFISEVQGHQKRYSKIVQFTHSSTKAAAIMLLGAVVALIVANSGAYEPFVAFWHTEVGLLFGSTEATMSLAHVINDLCMALFFLLVGLEVKYEMTVGELTNIRQALLPIMGACGGVMAPIVIYLLFNWGDASSIRGWGVPTATDIAFALGILALLGNRVPSGVRVFLSTLAVADDIIAIIVIAIFYASDISLFWLAMAAVVLAVLIAMNRGHIYSLAPYILVGIVLWYCVYMSGIHSTIAGVLLAFTIPSGSRINMKSFMSWSGGKVKQAKAEYDAETPVIAQEDYIETITSLSKIAKQVVPPATRLEQKLYPWVYFLILPLFALTNADVSLVGLDLGATVTSPVFLGVFLGLLLGKPIGITLMSFIVVKTGLSSLPKNVNWIHMIGAGILGGVGFTMAIFVANLAYNDESLIAIAKMGILSASLLAGIIGFTFLCLQANIAKKKGVTYLSVQSDEENLQTADREAVRESKQQLEALDTTAIEDVEVDKRHSGVFEITVDLGETGLLKDGSIQDVREAVRAELVRELREEGEDELLAKVEREFEERQGESPLVALERALRSSDEVQDLYEELAKTEEFQRFRDAVQRERAEAKGGGRPKRPDAE